MNSAANPYRDALRGLELADPVRAFFDWCRERERIREKRERGEPPQWSADPIFQRGRFLNVFREDDRGSRAVVRFVRRAGSSLPELLHALFFARWCNRDTTLDAMEPPLLRQPARLRHFLLHETAQPWFSEAYPVVEARWENRTYDRLEGGIELIPRALGFLEACVRGAAGHVVTATRRINAEFRMSNDFPIFMAVADIAWFDPSLIRPDSPVPTGIGSAPFMDLLQKHLGLPDHEATMAKMIELQSVYWPEARRAFTPIDVEYLCCECRKYYSYVNGTKRFEGRNLFTPNR
ncbi:MAG TPA: putative DNA base hypermodification protein [Kiritimatiellia bacterium]|nr:putative DNA base hypermodification protein [Kiritimatiellia bacterium]HRZ11840.1 putative DNA base hypermodification protein [Kiritimatiellia bacterium]HSA17354.1 putative DNA base hypermodification protein [Kiritimatiellia bacterium]